uniref:DUF3472 domain-containing protein n=1 Tax=Corethron hystrix TaxID=216773 RepID=A0A7S1FM33_9STRA|mmetsp:Transcript_14955/g.33320  ORF Transcript_14955/g.33320 Transcript_14955/m.33320 type:complete len:455 (+) Transcript_14955:69-1433(+)
MIFSRYFALISLSSLSFASADDVSCGGHRAPSCEECPYDSSGTYKGSAWCNGQCEWNSSSNKCVAKPGKKCGGVSTAKICADCPSGAAGCGDTDCSWHPFTSLCRDSFSDDVRTASVHLVYDKPISKPAWWFQRVVPTASAPSTYFSTNGHRFGYGGIQEVNSSTGRVIFSLWDQGGCNQDVDPNCNEDDLAKTIACGTGVTCRGFGGEGTGRQSRYDRAPFSLNEEYYFVTQAKYLGNKRMEHTGYFYDNGLWRLLSRIQVSTNNSEEWWISGLYSFVEQWTAVDTTKDRAALFGPSYMADEDATEFYQIKKVRFSHGTLENHERVNAWQAGEDWQQAVGIETGGNAEQNVRRGDTFTYPEYVPYGELTSFRKNIDCLNLAQSRDEIEACLNTNPSTDAPSMLPSDVPSDTPSISPVTARECVDTAFKHNGKKTCTKYLKKKKEAQRIVQGVG